MKGLTMAQWINLNQNDIPVLACWYSVLWEKTGLILLPLVDLTAGRPADKIQMDFEILKSSLQVKLFGLNITVMLLQC